jgi:hypothetical protein
METIPAYLDTLRRRERAARHAVFTPLLIHTVALALVLGLDVAFLVRLAHETRSDWSGGGWAAIAHDPRTLLPLLPLVVYVVLWIGARLRTWRTGVGPGHDGWGIMAIVSVAFLLLVPWGLLALLFLGAVFFLGLGLTVLGTRLREAFLWVPGLVLMAVGPLANLGTFDNHARFLGPWPTQVVLGAVTLGLAATTAAAGLRERRTLRPAPDAVRP